MPDICSRTSSSAGCATGPRSHRPWHQWPRERRLSRNTGACSPSRRCGPGRARDRRLRLRHRHLDRRQSQPRRAAARGSTSRFRPQLAREHNDANVLALGARLIGSDMAKACVTAFLDTRLRRRAPPAPRRPTRTRIAGNRLMATAADLEQSQATASRTASSPAASARSTPRSKTRSTPSSTASRRRSS